MAAIPGAQLLVKVTPVDIFPNCPRYIPRIEVLTPSDYLPAADGAPVEPKWKSFERLQRRRSAAPPVVGTSKPGGPLWRPDILEV
jgi:hypothetical protein